MAKKKAPFRYRVLLGWSDADGTYVARVPAFPGISADGATLEEAGREIAIALQLTLDSAVDHGDQLPPEDITVTKGPKGYRCPACAKGTVKPVAKAGRKWRYKGKLLKVPDDLEIETCPACGEEYISPEVAKAITASLKAQYAAAKKKPAAKRRARYR